MFYFIFEYLNLPTKSWNIKDNNFDQSCKELHALIHGIFLRQCRYGVAGGLFGGFPLSRKVFSGIGDRAVFGMPTRLQAMRFGGLKKHESKHYDS
jgi:hypothetical protein